MTSVVAFEALCLPRAARTASGRVRHRTSLRFDEIEPVDRYQKWLNDKALTACAYRERRPRRSVDPDGHSGHLPIAWRSTTIVHETTWG